MDYTERIDELVERLGETNDDALWERCLNSLDKISEVYGEDVLARLEDDNEAAFELWLRARAYLETGLLPGIEGRYPHLFEDAEAVEE